MTQTIRVAVVSRGLKFYVQEADDSFDCSPYGCFDVVIEDTQIVAINPVGIGIANSEAVKALIDDIRVTEHGIKIISSGKPFQLD